jgi:DNA modification methylase
MTIRVLTDIKPQTPVAAVDRTAFAALEGCFAINEVASVTGMSPAFVRKVCGRKTSLSAADVLALLDQDAYAETFVPRSRVLNWLLERESGAQGVSLPTLENGFCLLQKDALSLINSLPDESVQCVVTSTPYWALRIYKDSFFADWADGVTCPFGHEQTPESFVRHTSEILHALLRVLKPEGSIWWNIMDSFNTRTQIRGNAAEALRAMQGKDKRSWSQHECRRYSAGHSYLKDGEQCLIPSRVAERASRLGFYVKSVITWAKTSSLPEPQESRVSRNLEYVLHMSKTRTPTFNKQIYRELPADLGGRNNGSETDKLSDVWTLPTSSGRDGHGAQFPLALPGRCIALSTRPEDLVLDPFVGSGNSGVAARRLGRRFIGSDVSADYLKLAMERLGAAGAQRSGAPKESLSKPSSDTSAHPPTASTANSVINSAAPV